MAAAAAGTILLRSVGRKMACRRLSSSSIPTGSTPSPKDNKDLIEAIRLECAKESLRRVSIYSACLLVFGGSIYYGLVLPKVEEIREQRWAKTKDEIMQALEPKYQSVHIIQGRDAISEFCKAQSMEASGHGKEPDGH